MLSIRLITAGGEDYYVNLAAEDYYVAGGEPMGKWCCAGAAALKLIGTVDPKAFRRVFRGYHPSSGAAMVQNAGYSDRQCAWDFTFSAPKSLSIIWCVVNSVVRALIQKFQQLAAEAALLYAEQNLVFSRAGKGGTESRSVGLVVSTWEHGTNRLLQAQLHTHALLMNLGVAADGKTRAIYSKLMFRYKKVLGAYYRAHLAHLLESELGFTLNRKGDSFEIVGVPEDLIRLHSQRRAEILAYLKKKKQHGAVAAAEAALKTRRTKKDIPPRSQLFQRWQEFNRTHGFTEASVAALRKPKSRNLAQDLPQALASAAERIADRFSHFSQKDFLFEALLEAPKWGIPPETVPQAVRDYLTTAADIVKLQAVDGETRYTTRAILKQEARLLRLTTQLRRSPGCKTDYHRVEKMLTRFPTLRPDQAGAVRYLTRGKGRLRILCGKAGTGKTTTLRVARKIWLKQGYRVIGATFTGKAAKVLQDATDIKTDTIHRQMADFKISPKRAATHHFRQLIRALQGKPTYRMKKLQPIKVDSKTIVAIDEAGMVSARHLRIIMRHVQKGGGTLVLLGDPTQLPPIEAKGGAPFQSISRRAGFAELTQICRQEDEWARDAVELFSNGRTGEALRLYADHGLVTVREDREEALKALVVDWTAVGLTSPERAAVLVATNLESEMANHLCKAKRLEAGCLDACHSIEIRDQDFDKAVAYVNRVHVGDRILFTCNSRRYHVENGAVGTVLALNPALFRKSIAVKLDDGRRVVIPVKDFPHMRLGYAYTTHKSQGMTLQHTFVLAGGPSQDLPISYVQASRATHSTRFYTEKALLDEYLEDIENSPLAKQMSTAPNLALATDLLPNAPADLGISQPARLDDSTPNRSSTTSTPPRKHRNKRRRQRRKPPPQYANDQTYAMAQVEEFERRRKWLLRHAIGPDSLPAAYAITLPPQIEQSPDEFYSTRYLQAASDDSIADLNTASLVPIEIVLDAHFAEATLQAEVVRDEEEQERLHQERLDELQRQRQAASQEQAVSQLADSQIVCGSSSYLAPQMSSSSSTFAFGQSSFCPVVSVNTTWSAIDQQAFLTTLAAQTKWTQDNQPFTTTAFVHRY